MFRSDLDDKISVYVHKCLAQIEQLILLTLINEKVGGKRWGVTRASVYCAFVGARPMRFDASFNGCA